MADVAWPGSLPSQQFGQSEKPAGILASFSTGDGMKPLRRKRFSGLAVITSYSFIMTSAQMATFRAFWAGPLQSGVNDITMFDYSISAHVRLTPTDAYEAVSISSGVWNVTIPVRRELVL